MKRPAALPVLAASLLIGLLVPAAPAQSAVPAVGVAPRIAVFTINTAADLQSLHDDTTNWQGAIITLANPVDMSGYTWTNGIGDDTTPFTSTFDGNSHRITNLSVNVTTTASRAAAGLFGVLGAGHDVRNLTVTGSITSQASSSNASYYATSGGIAGFATGGTIRNVAFKGTVEAGNTSINSSRAGGIVGTASGQTILKAMVPLSATTVEATGGDPIAGGLVGQANGATSISQSSSAAAVRGRNGTGSGATEVGGLVGQMYLSGVTMANSYAVGALEATRAVESVGYPVDIGGIAGAVMGGGGGAGTGGSLARIYSVSTVATTNFSVSSIDAGALIGSLSDDTVSGAFFDSAILPTAVGNLQSGNVDDTGTTRAALQSFSTFAGSWPIVSTWESPGANLWGICEGQSFPYLLWQVGANPCIATNTISGTPAVGQQLTANADTFDDSLAYQWGTLTGSTFASIAGADDSVYTVVGANAGTSLAVRVTNLTVPFDVTGISSPVAIPNPTPPPVYPPGAPRAVTAVAGDASATITWTAPADTGSFPITTYQVTASPGGKSCLSAALTCTVSGLANGASYTFTVRALNGAGWGPESVPSNPVTPSAAPSKSIVITGSRGTVNGRSGVIVQGRTTDLVGATATPWIRFPGQTAYRPGSSTRVVSADGTFTWQRQTGKKVYVYFTAGDTRSNRIVIRP